jgi:hypothetical protein
MSITLGDYITKGVHTLSYDKSSITANMDCCFHRKGNSKENEPDHVRGNVTSFPSRVFVPLNGPATFKVLDPTHLANYTAGTVM